MKKSFNQDLLKLFALFAMVVDHVGEIFFPDTVLGFWMRATIGRTVFPIFAFLVVVHLFQKGCYEKYLKRLGLFAFFSQFILFPFIGVKLNIFFSLFLFVFLFFCFKKARKRAFSLNQLILTDIIIWTGCACLSFYCPYEIYGLLFMTGLYSYLETKQRRFLFFTLFCAFLMNWIPGENILFGVSSTLTTVCLLSFCWSGRRFLKRWYLFYAFYPIHLFFLYLLKATLS